MRRLAVQLAAGHVDDVCLTFLYIQLLEDDSVCIPSLLEEPLELWMDPVGFPGRGDEDFCDSMP